MCSGCSGHRWLAQGTAVPGSSAGRCRAQPAADGISSALLLALPSDTKTNLMQSLSLLRQRAAPAFAPLPDRAVCAATWENRSEKRLGISFFKNQPNKPSACFMIWFFPSQTLLSLSPAQHPAAAAALLTPREGRRGRKRGLRRRLLNPA